MQFFTLPVLALLTLGALSMPNDLEARDIEARVNCKSILPLCAGGTSSGPSNCRCKGMIPPCGIWQCPGSGGNTVMSCGSEGTGCVWL